MNKILLALYLPLLLSLSVAGAQCDRLLQDRKTGSSLSINDSGQYVSFLSTNSGLQVATQAALLMPVITKCHSLQFTPLSPYRIKPLQTCLYPSALIIPCTFNTTHLHYLAHISPFHKFW